MGLSPVLIERAFSHFKLKHCLKIGNADFVCSSICRYRKLPIMNLSQSKEVDVSLCQQFGSAFEVFQKWNGIVKAEKFAILLSRRQVDQIEYHQPTIIVEDFVLTIEQQIVCGRSIKFPISLQTS